jgi:hypothetical protein
MSLGLILNRRNDNWNNFNNGTPWGADSLGIKQPIVPTTILFSYALNKNFVIGLAPYIAMWSNESISGNRTDKGSANTFGASLGVMKMIKKGWVEGVINFRMNSFKREITDSGTSFIGKSEGGIALGVGLRAWIYGKSSKIAIVPVAGFNIYSWNPRITTTGPSFDSISTKYSYLSFNAGVGMNWPISDDIQLAGGVTVVYSSVKGELGSSTDKTTQFVAPEFNLAGETRIADWLTGRLGYNRGINRYKNEVTSGSSTSSYAETFPTDDVQTVSLGAGFHFGRFSIDATVSEKWLKEGIYFVSGKSNSLFGVVSASYNFHASK